MEDSFTHGTAVSSTPRPGARPTDANRAWNRPSPFRAVARVPASEADLARRGVRAADPARAETLKGIAHRFLAGYNAMLDAQPLTVLERQLGETDPSRHGFVVEGAAMGAAMRDALSLRSGLLEALIDAHGTRFEYLISVGAGWAIAKTPWRAARIHAAFDPLLAPLTCDGRGFHDLFFDPGKAETGKIARYRGARARGYDAGLGRALWFVASGHVPRVSDLIARFPAERRPDLLAGIGLAMSFAGPATKEDWAALRSAHAENWPHVGQGVCFATEAMRLSGTIPDHTALACRAALDMSPEAAADIAAATRPANVMPESGDAAYEAWRAAIRNRLTPKEAA